VLFRDDAPDGFVVHPFAGDDPLVCKDYVRERLGLPARDWRKRGPSDLPARKPARATRPTEDDQTGRIKASVAIFQGARSIRDTPALAYLVNRGLHLDENTDHVLRFSATLKLSGEPAMGMVALMRDVLTNEPCGVHRTFLDRDGRKIDRKMLGRAKGAAIKLDPNEDVTAGLHIVEGIETGLSGRQLGYRPIWAVGSAGGIAEFPLLAGLEALTVFDENDPPSTRAALACIKRYRAAGSEAHLGRPPIGDLNDSLLAGAL
jgi:hypothetical protein